MIPKLTGGVCNSLEAVNSSEFNFLIIPSKISLNIPSPPTAIILKITKATSKTSDLLHATAKHTHQMVCNYEDYFAWSIPSHDFGVMLFQVDRIRRLCLEAESEFSSVFQQPFHFHWLDSQKTGVVSDDWQVLRQKATIRPKLIWDTKPQKIVFGISFSLQNHYICNETATIHFKQFSHCRLLYKR